MPWREMSDSERYAINRFPVSYGMSPLDSMYAAYQSQMNAANRANQLRYQAILAGYKSRRNRVMSSLQGQGQARATDIGRQFQDQMGATQQDLVSRGLSNTTVLSGAQTANTEAKQRALNENAEMVRRQQAEYDSGLSGDMLQFMERRNDVAPDFSQMAQLAQAYGQGDGGMAAGRAGHAGPVGYGGPMVPPVGYGGPMVPPMAWGYPRVPVGYGTPVRQRKTPNPLYVQNLMARKWAEQQRLAQFRANTLRRGVRYALSMRR